MSYLIDTNVISELIKPKPDKNVLNWFNNIPDDALHISVLTLGEIRKGVENVKAIEKKEKLRIWLKHELTTWFEGRILSVDQLVAERWGCLQYEMRRPIPAIDSLIAATALHHDLRLVSRNETDFKFPTLIVINPWNN